MGDRVRVGVVGLGQWGRHHARILASMPGVVLAGVADVDAREASETAARYGTSGFTDFRELIGLVDAASIVVPTGMHYSVAREFIEAGVHVLIEKPIAATVEEARLLVDMGNRLGKTLLVGHVERFKPAVQHLREIVRDPLFIQARRVRPFDPHRVMDVGVVLDLMIHDLDIALSLAPGRILEMGGVGVCVHNSHEDLAVAHLTTEGGCRMTFTSSRVSAVKAVEIEITMPEMSVHLDYLRQVISIRRLDGRHERYALEGEEPLRAELAHFVSCARGEASPLVPGEDGLRALDVSHRLLKRLVPIVPRVPA